MDVRRRVRISDDPSAVLQMSPRGRSSRGEGAWEGGEGGRRRGRRGGGSREGSANKEVVCSCGFGQSWKRGALCGLCVIILIGGLVRTPCTTSLPHTAL